TDADLIKISVTRIMNNLQAIRRNKEVGYKLLKFQMGLDLEEKVVLKDRLEDILQIIDVEQAYEGEFKLENNIDFKLMSTQEKLSEMSLKNEKAKYLPTITAFYTFQWNAMRDAFNFFNSKERWYRMQVLGVNISIPIFQSGRQRAKVQQASISLQQARNAKRQASQGLVLEAARTKAAFDSAYENYLNTQENMHLSKKVYDVTLIKYKEGVATSMDLTQAHDKFLMSQSEYIQALSGLLSAKNKLDRLNNNYESFD
ncbi:MAG: TolC family protein, partial [Candidatus Aminicenantes bacterium]|nr:TolC family protein [Candidatus Aminicenantes bacterium]